MPNWLDEKLNKLFELKEQIRKEGNIITELKDSARDLEKELIDNMDDIGLSKIGTSVCNFSIREDVVPSVDAEHWDEVRSWAMKNGYGQLLQRKLNTAPYKELIEMGVEIPWVKPHKITKTSLTKRR